MPDEFNNIVPAKHHSGRNDSEVKMNESGAAMRNKATIGDEYVAYREDNAPGAKEVASVAVKIKETENARAKIISAVAAIAGAVVVGVVSVDDIFVAPPKIDYTIEAFTDGVRYTVGFDLDAYTPKDGIKVIVKNDFTNREQLIIAPEKDERPRPDQNDVHPDVLEPDGTYFFSYEGYFEGLQTNMTYTFRVVDGSKTLVTDTFKTKGEELNVMLTDDRVRFSSFEVYDTGVWGSIEISDYVPRGEMSVAVSGEGEYYARKVRFEDFGTDGGAVTVPRFAGEDEARDDEDYEEAFFGRLTPDGSVFIEFWFDDLTPDKEYVLSVLDGGRAIYEMRFGTAQKDYSLWDWQISFDPLTVGDKQFSSEVTITDYVRESDMSVTLTGGGTTVEKRVVFYDEQDMQSPIEEDFDEARTLSGSHTETGDILLWIWFEDLTPSTEYEVAIVDNGHVLYEKRIVTDEEDFTLEYGRVSFSEMEAYDTGVSGTLTIYDYDPIGEMTLTVDGDKTATKRVVIETDYGGFKDDEFDEMTDIRGYVEEGDLTMGFWFEDLTPSTEYTLYIVDAGHVIYETYFETLDESVYLTEDQISFDPFEVGSTEVSGYVTITDYVIVGEMYLSLFGDGKFTDKPIIFTGDGAAPGSADGDGNSIVGSVTEDGIEFGFFFTGLTADTFYYLMLYDDGEEIYSLTFETESFTAPTLDEDQLTENVFEASWNGLTVGYTINGYSFAFTPQIAVVGDGSTAQLTVYFDEADVPEGEENYVVASVLEGGATAIEAQFEGLSELTDYAFMLCDGEYVIYEKQFATPERSYLLSEDQVDASVEASRSSVYIFLELYGYEPMGAMYASVTSADATIGKAVVFGEENLTGEEEDEYVLAEVDESDGTIYIVCGFDYLAPETTFDFALTDDGHVVYETQATTESYAVDPSSVSMTIYPGKNSWSCAFTISDYYEFDGELAVSVSDGNGQTVSYVPVSLYTEGAQKPEGFDGTYYDYVITVDGVGGSGLVGNTQYTLSVSDGGYAIYFTTFTTRNFVLDESAVTMDNQFHTDSTSGTGYFDVNYFALTGYDPATNIVVGLYTLDGTLVQNTDFIVYNASDGNVGNSGTVQREGNAVTSITVPYIQLYGVPPGQRYYFRIYDGNTLLYEAVWIAA